MASQTFGKRISPYGIYFSLMLWGRILDNPAGPVVSLDSKLSTHSAALWLNSTFAAHNAHSSARNMGWWTASVSFHHTSHTTFGKVETCPWPCHPRHGSENILRFSTFSATSIETFRIPSESCSLKPWGSLPIPSLNNSSSLRALHPLHCLSSAMDWLFWDSFIVEQCVAVTL